MESMLNRLRVEIQFHSRKLNLPSHAVNEIPSIILNVFGEEWLEGKLAKRLVQDEMVPKISEHPFIRLLKVPGESQISELAELVTYLKKLRETKGLIEVISNLKHGKSYRSAFIQLAFAHRFSMIGSENVELEPVTDQGKSDIYFEYDGKPYLAEVFVPKRHGNENVEDNFRKGIEIIKSTIKDSKKCLRISVSFKYQINLNEGTDLGRLVKNEINSLETNHVHLDSKYAAVCIEYVTSDYIAEEGKSWLTEQSPSYSVMSLKAVPNLNITEVMRKGTSPSGRYYGSILLWPPKTIRNQLPDIVKMLKMKISSKVKQTKRELDNPRRLVIVSYSFHDRKHELDYEIAAQIRNSLVANFSNIAGVLLTNRTLAFSDLRHFTEGVWAKGSDGNALPDRWAADMCEGETNKSFIRYE